MNTQPDFYVPAEAAPSFGRQSGSVCLDIDHVSLEYGVGQGSIKALEATSLQIMQNEFAAIVGPSGCGKSSLLYLASGLVPSTHGEMRVNGNIITGPGVDRGMVFQTYTLFPWLNVRDNIAFGPRRRGKSKKEIEEVVNYYINEIGLARFADAWPRQLSGGMMQRVAIARALANDPDVLLMDEPFGALDSQTRLQMQQLLLEVWDHNNKTVLFVTHDIDEAIFLADRVYVMSGRPGRIHDIIDIGLSRPRDGEVVMASEFIDIKRRILKILSAA
ncbi:ABC transporter ATP-binding protein [Kushneria aurantia]|uniref:ABC transporter ATP-binding protein n=1 Tax=Kushneria aurantia TaxID=504092 RepID=A0ABV6FZR8_9GAMM|nr:ABC transporter ATP-binding protein [Kushneria aurantia]